MTSYEVVVDVSKVVHLARRHGIPYRKSKYRSFEVQANDPDDVCYLVVTKLWFELTKEAFVSAPEKVVENLRSNDDLYNKFMQRVKVVKIKES